MNWLDYLQQAHEQPVGLALICNSAENADSAKRQLYAARAKARDKGNKTFDALSISMSPHADDILYIYSREESEDNESAET